MPRFHSLSGSIHKFDWLGLNANRSNKFFVMTSIRHVIRDTKCLHFHFVPNLFIQKRVDLQHTFIETLHADSDKVDVLTVVTWVYASMHMQHFIIHDLTKDLLAPEIFKVSNYSIKQSLLPMKPINISQTVKIYIAKC